MKRLEDLAQRATRQSGPVATRFLSPAECLDAQTAARAKDVYICFNGGYEGAERKVGFFSDSFLPAPPDEGQIRWLSIGWNPRYGSLNHRDILGALMSLGMERDVFGDILTGEGIAYVVALKEASPFISAQLEKVGSMSVRVMELDETPDLPEPLYRVRRDTVASLRLDAVVAAAYHLSRQDAQSLIRAGLCKVDHRPMDGVDHKLINGSLLSLRGKGRVRLGEIGGTNRRGRTSITLLFYE